MNYQYRNAEDDAVVTKQFESVFAQIPDKGFYGNQRHYKSDDISND